MKLLITLALFAVAYADQVQVVNLPRAAIPAFQMPDIRPLLVPQEVIEALKVMQPVLRDVEIPEELRIRFVDAPLEAPVEAEANAYEAVDDVKVRFVDFAPVAEEIVAPIVAEVAAPIVEEITAPEAFDEGLEVHFVDLPLDSVAEESAGPAVEDIAAPDAVRFVDAPIAEIVAPEPVRIAEAPLPAFETVDLAAPKSGVEAVKVAIPRLPGKQYADPRLR